MTHCKMECPSLPRRVSTRASHFSSASHRHNTHLSTLNPSQLPTSSRPTPAASLVISPDLLASRNGSKFISNPRLANPLASASHSSPSSALCPALSSTQIAAGGDGQFSDADTDEEDGSEAHKSKKVKLNSSHSKQPSLSQPNKHNPHTPSSKSSTFIQGAEAYQAEERPEAPVRTALPIPSNTKSTEHIDTKLLSTRPSKPCTPAASNHPTSLRYDSKAQLPIATRRLATLVGIPESSQAIIQSTLSIPPSRSNHSNSQPHASTSVGLPISRTRTNSKSTADLPTSKSINCSASSSYLPSDCPPRHPNPLSSTGPAGHSPRESSNRSTTVSARQAQACKSTPTSRAVQALTANTSECGSIQGRTLPPPTGSTRDTTAGTNPDAPHGLVAPRYGRPSNSSATDDFIMPAPGSFSIRAPPSSQLLHAYDPTLLSPETPELTNRGGNRLEAFEESSEFDASSQPPSTCPAYSPPANSSTAGQLPGLSSPAPGNRNKRKSRSSKSNPVSTSPGSDSGRPEVELVKPPPTINGKVSHGRKVPVGYVKRTPNSFLMFRSHVIANKLLPPGVEHDNRQISRVVSGLWAGLSEEDLRSWQAASRELRAAARAKNPGLKHAPNQKRKEVVRRRRNGQLPGETPEQRVQREKAAAAELAKVIIRSSGDRLQQENAVQPSASNASAQPSDSQREPSRPEFRAPSYYFSQASVGQVATPRSEYSESTLTTSPAAEARRSLSCVPESDGDVSSGARQTIMTPMTVASVLSAGNHGNACPTSGKSTPAELPFRVDPTSQAPQQGPSTAAVNLGTNSELSQSTARPLLFSPIPPSAQPAGNPRETPPSQSGLLFSPVSASSQTASTNAHEIRPSQPGAQSYSGGFSHMGSGFDVSGSFQDTFSNEMLRSLGLAASDLNLPMPTSGSLPLAPTTTNAENYLGSNFGLRDDEHERGSAFWSQDSGFSNFVNTSSADYPFRESNDSEANCSQITAQGIGQTSYPSLSQASQADSSANPLEFGSLVDTSYDPLKCDHGLNFDAMFLSYQSSSQALEEARESLTTNPADSHPLGSTTGDSSSLAQDYPKDFWLNS